MASEAKKATTEGGIAGFAAVVLVLALLGGGAGFGFKVLMPGAAAKGEPIDARAGNSESQRGEVKSVGAAGGTKASAESSTEQLMALEPVVVTMADPKGVRVRIEAAVIFIEHSKVDRTLLLREMAQDIMIFLKTTTLAQIETASGMEFLQEDLAELVKLRSKGAARGLVIKALMVE